MKVHSEIPHLNEKVALTVGTFDGIHKGHQKLFEQLKEDRLKTVVFTFQNHPTTILRPHKPALPLITNEHKVQLLKAFSIDHLLLIPFTPAFADLTSKAFFEELSLHMHLESLHLGYDAKLGKNGSGDIPNLSELSKHFHFRLDILPPVEEDGEPISSTRIRHHILKGELTQASRLLGRPYSILAKPTPGAGRGKKMGFPTLNFPLPSLTLPPLGVWAVHVGPLKGIANLGIAPTFERPGPPLLEVHLLDPFSKLPDLIEVTFIAHLRNEKKFSSSDELKQQIAHDIQKVRDLKFI